MGPRDQVMSLAAALATLLWGLLLAPHGYAEGDASELTLVLAVGGVPHPTGYPLYTLAGHLFVRLSHAVGIAWPVAANAWSALGGAVAAFFLCRLALSLGDDRLPASGPARGFLALMPWVLFTPQPIWSWALCGAEVTSWHVAWVAIAAWAAWRLGGAAIGDPDGRAAAPIGGRAAFVWGCVVGAGLAHHATSVLVSLPLTLWLVSRRRGARAADLAPRFALGLAAPLVSLSWIAYRAAVPAAYQWPLLEPGVAGLVAHATGRAFGGYLGGFGPTGEEARRLLTALPWLGLSLPALIAAGVSRGAAARRSFARALAAAAIAQAAFLFAYRVPDPSWLALPVLVLAAVWIPRSFAALAARLGFAVAALAVAALAIAILPPWIGRDVAARRGAEETDRIVRAAWERVPFERGLVYWSNDLLPRLRAYQLLEGSHPGRTVEHPGMLTWEGPRRAFRSRLGFDPWGGTLPEHEGELGARLERAAAGAGVPVLDFDDAIRGSGD